MTKTPTPTGYSFMTMGKCPTCYPAGQMPPPPATFSDLPYAMVGEAKEVKGGKVPGVFAVGDRVRVVNLDMKPDCRIAPETVTIGDLLTIKEIDPSDPLTNIRLSNSYWFSASNLEHADLEPLAEGQRFRIGDRVRFTLNVDGCDVQGKLGVVEGFYIRGIVKLSTEFDPGCSFPYFVRPDDSTILAGASGYVAGHTFGCFACDDKDIDLLP